MPAIPITVVTVKKKKKKKKKGKTGEARVGAARQWYMAKNPVITKRLVRNGRG